MEKDYNLLLSQEMVVYLEELLSSQEQKLLDRWDRGIDARDNNIQSINTVRRIRETLYEAQGYYDNPESTPRKIGFQAEPEPKKENKKEEVKMEEVDIVDVFDQLSEEDLKAAIDIAYELMEEKYPKEKPTEVDLVTSLTEVVAKFTDEEVQALVKTLVQDENHIQVVIKELANEVGLDLNEILAPAEKAEAEKEETSGLFEEESGELFDE